MPTRRENAIRRINVALDALVENGWRCEYNMPAKPTKGATDEPRRDQMGGQDVQVPKE